MRPLGPLVQFVPLLQTDRWVDGHVEKQTLDSRLSHGILTEKVSIVQVHSVQPCGRNLMTKQMRYNDSFINKACLQDIYNMHFMFTIASG